MAEYGGCELRLPKAWRPSSEWPVEWWLPVLLPAFEEALLAPSSVNSLARR
jgi:hypothetical protein